MPLQPVNRAADRYHMKCRPKGAAFLWLLAIRFVAGSGDSGTVPDWLKPVPTLRTGSDAEYTTTPIREREAETRDIGIAGEDSASISAISRWQRSIHAATPVVQLSICIECTAVASSVACLPVSDCQR